MALTSGTRLGPYEILAPIGAGGMGEVYKAKDTRLDRTVAIKVLPEHLAESPERKARFKREAKAISQLNHPHICTLYDVGQQDGVDFLVMELVEGETLAERLAHGPMRVEEALPLFQQIAEGIEAAHAKSIIHRDLKPSNIKITPEGKPKILDFGLAKAALQGEVSAESPTVTRQGTETGVILGTAAYMSPEQARGQALDKRTDLWSFGCMLYEALTGNTPFLEETFSETLASILRKEPDWDSLPAGVPSRIRTLLHRCLSRERRGRLHDMADGRLDIEEASEAIETPIQQTLDLEGRKRVGTMVVLAALFGSVLGALLAWNLTPEASEVPAPVTRSTISLPAGDGLSLGYSNASTFSPNGEYAAYVVSSGNTRSLYLHRLAELEGRPVDGADRAQMPFFSPDSQWLGFFAGGQIMKVSVSGGAPVAVVDMVTDQPRGASWGDDGYIVFSTSTAAGLSRVSADGGQAEVLSIPNKERREKTHRFPHVLPGAKSVLFTLGTGDIATWDDASIAILSVETGEYRILVEGGMNARYSPTGHLLYARRGELFAVAFLADGLGSQRDTDSDLEWTCHDTGVGQRGV